MSNIKDEIRFYGDNEDIVWKSPITDFNTGSVVIVNESQGAVFYLNGEASDDLGPGLHVLETCDTPFIKRIIQRIQKTKTPFQAELYYVNKVEMAQLRWGIGDITYSEEGFVFPIGARGIYNVQIENARKFIEKINGTANGIQKDALEERFLELVCSVVGDKLINAIYDKAGTIISAPRYRVEIMDSVKNDIASVFEEYGVKLTQFVIEHIHVDEKNANYQKLLSLMQLEGGGKKARLLEAEIAAQERGIQGQGEAAYRAAQGYTYQQEKQFEILNTAVQNDNSAAGGITGSFMQMGVGLGTMGAIGSIVKESVSGAVQDLNGTVSAQKHTCKKCGAEVSENAKFCLECGSPIIPDDMTVCPQCNKTVKKGKFCLECGASLDTRIKCPNCNNVFEGGKFCPECGAKI